MEKTFVKGIQWQSDNTFVPEFVRFSVDTERMKELMKNVRENNLEEIRVRADGEYFDDVECTDEHTEFRSDVERFIVYGGSFLYYAQHKHNSSDQFETEEVSINDLDETTDPTIF